MTGAIAFSKMIIEQLIAGGKKKAKKVFYVVNNAIETKKLKCRNTWVNGIGFAELNGDL